MKDEHKLARMITFLTESHLETHGGYPHDHLVIDDELIVADLDDGKERNATKLERYPIDELLEWHDEAMKHKRTTGDDWESSLYETQPGGLPL